MNEEQTNNEASDIGRAMIALYEIWRDLKRKPEVKRPVESALRYTLEAMEMLNREKEIETE